MIDDEVMMVNSINEAIRAFHNGETDGALEVEALDGGLVYLCIICKPACPDAPCPTIYKNFDGRWKHEALLPHCES